MIQIRGAREHNLKNIDVDIPHHELCVVTGLSGSGKSSLALDTLFAEGQRRFVESLSAYARQFLGLMQKPRVDHITGLAPAISIEQRNTSTGLRSTVATSTEIYDYLRLLYAHLGVPHCPHCGSAIEPQTTDEILSSILALPEGTRIEILAPVIRGKKGEHREVFKRARREGYVRVRVDGTTYALNEVPELARYNTHTIEIVVDRVVVKDGVRSRLADSVETALGLGDDRLIVGRPGHAGDAAPEDRWTPLQPGDLLYSKAYACTNCEQPVEFEPLAPRLFSFNSPYGACGACHGLGVSLRDFSSACPDCGGARLKAYSRAVTVRDVTIIDLTGRSVSECLRFLHGLGLNDVEQHIVGEVCKELGSRLQFLEDVGLGYLTLSRRSGSLSGGEAQRIRLASQIGTGLTGVLYVLDEPSIGLHARDNEKLLRTLAHLRDLGNTVVVVEHDAETIRRADYVVDLGPGAGAHGGEVIYQGPYKGLLDCRESLTAAYLRGDCVIKPPERRRTPRKSRWLTLSGASVHNLQSITARFPLGLLTCVTGVSGSGKSSLVTDTLLPALRCVLYDSVDTPGPYTRLSGTGHVDKVIVVDQSPIGRTPRSNPATYTGVMTHIRNLYAGLPESRVRGYKVGRFSFNVRGGRCESCQGTGVKQIEMHFLPDVYVTCEACQGTRYNRETLEVKYRGKTIADVLAMTVEEAADFFARVPTVTRILTTLRDVGLEYITLGQHATTISGGEAQRVKLSTELSKRDTGRTVYILDEPTTGLHFADIDKLIRVLQRLVDAGNTVIVIEHNLDVIKCADHIIDLGPDGGDAGGRVVAEGPPEAVMQAPESATGQFLADMRAAGEGQSRAA
jgi:excinuclease ABC subunit A